MCTKKKCNRSTICIKLHFLDISMKIGTLLLPLVLITARKKTTFQSIILIRGTLRL